MELNFFYAKHKHKMWKMHLKAYLLGLDDFDEKRIVSSKDCELGKWINAFAKNKYKGHPELSNLIRLHDNIHQIVIDIPDLKKQGKVDEAYKKLHLLENESAKFIAILEALEKEENKN